MQKGQVIGICFALFVTISSYNAIARDSFGDVFCEAMRGTGLVMRCSVLNAERAVVSFIHTDSTETASMCRGIVNMIKARRVPSGGWTLRIHSPFDRSVPLATCRF